jgi:hypothetical protein
MELGLSSLRTVIRRSSFVKRKNEKYALKTYFVFACASRETKDERRPLGDHPTLSPIFFTSAAETRVLRQPIREFILFPRNLLKNNPMKIAGQLFHLFR